MTDAEVCERFARERMGWERDGTRVSSDPCWRDPDGTYMAPAVVVGWHLDPRFLWPAHELLFAKGWVFPRKADLTAAVLAAIRVEMGEES